MTLKVRISNLFFGLSCWLKEKITGEETLYMVNPEGKGGHNETEPRS